jgi:predicted metal-dependent peptidase
MIHSLPSGGETLARMEKGLRLLTVPLPHLAGLAAAVRVALDERVPTMGVFASGRLIANPDFVAKLKDNELQFVLAHELLHLALRTHDRARGADRLEFNYAHDYIINDILRVELGFAEIPAGGLDMPGARSKSAEQIVLEMRKRAEHMPTKSQVWRGEQITLRRLLEAGGVGGDDGSAEAGDVLSADKERDWFPREAAEQAAREKTMGELAEKSLALAKAMNAMRGRGNGDSVGDAMVAALRARYRTPWEVALQTWLESVAPGERTYARPSRRGQAADDIVLPGRKRHSWMLNVVLDTSGSMVDEIPRALGAIAHFCEALAVDDIRLIQCDTAVTFDEVVTPAALAEFKVSGFGGSDLSAAMHALAEDAHVTAAVVITDGDIDYPRSPMPYAVLWVLPENGGAGFDPAYGRVVTMNGGFQ